MGGVWFSAHPATPATAILWRSAFPLATQQSLVTRENPTGPVSISDFELAAMIAHKDVLARHTNLAERTIWMATDNRAALSWSDKGSSTSLAARLYLLRHNALHQRQYRYVAVHDHIAGRANVMADDASRLWHLSDDALLTHFNLSYPQASPWQLHRLAPSTNSALIGALSKQRPKRGFRHSAPNPLPPLGHSGQPSVQASPLIPINFQPIPSPFYKSSPNDSAPAPWHPAVDSCALAQWKTRSVPWARRMRAWGPRTLA